jgi:S-adenosylmethionine hydrolase
MLDYLPHDSIVVGVVDPGVGGERFPIAVQLGERWLVGPDNGLFSRSIAWSTFQARYWTLETSIDVANTFHGRDVFLPVAIELASRELGRIHRAKDPRDLLTFRHAEDIKCDDWRVIHIDHYGNLISGIRGTAVSSNQTVLIAGRELAHADFYECVPVGECFWHVNSIGLLEIAANQDSAARALDVEGGAEIAV